MPFPDSVQSADRRAPGHAHPRCEVAAGRRRGGRQGVLGRRGRRRWATATPTTVIDTLRELSRKELVRPARRSSMQGEAEYAFWHILTRDVAYNQLPRASRASRHVAAAAWIESQGPRPRRRPGRRPRLPLRDRAGARPRRRTDRSGGDARGAGAAVPHPRRGTRARPRHRGGPHQSRTGARAHPRGPPRPAGRAWSASPRRPSTPDAPARRAQRWRRRSPPCRRAAICRPRPAP